MMFNIKRLFNRLRPCSVARLDYLLESPHKQIAEIYWASIFNSTIMGSKWLKNYSFSPGRWAVGYPFLYVLYRILNEINPVCILELGLGQSSKMILQYTAYHTKTQYTIVEHDLKWINLFKKNIDKFPSNAVLLPLAYKEIVYQQQPVTIFNGLQEHCIGKQFNLIIIDAPIMRDSKTHLKNAVSRIDILSLIPQNLASSFIILIDDLQMPRMKRSFALLKQHIEENHLAYCEAYYGGEKEMGCIASPDNFFIMTL